MRRAQSEGWLKHYHATVQAKLLAAGKEDEAHRFTYEACVDEHVRGGLGRWIWFVPVLTAMGLPAPMLQFFHDQVCAFVHDHVKDPSTSPLPRS